MITNCPQCGSSRMHRSRGRHAVEGAIVLLGGSFRRCHACNFRYVAFGSSFVRPADLRRISERLLLTVVMAVAAILIMGAIVWFSRSQAAANDTGSLVPDRRPAVNVERV